MSHEDFAAYVGEGKIIAGHLVTLVTGFDALHILVIDRSTEIPLVFDGTEGFESRVNRMEAAVERWSTRMSAAA
jgi:hypothetical protein